MIRLRGFLPALAILAASAGAALAQRDIGGASPLPDIQAMLPRDLSPWGMFLGANLVVKAVCILLAVASVATWTVWLAKTSELIGARRRLRQAIDEIARSASDDAMVLFYYSGHSDGQSLYPHGEALPLTDVRERLSRMAASGSE